MRKKKMLMRKTYRGDASPTKVGTKLGCKFPVTGNIRILKDLVARVPELRIARTVNKLALKKADRCNLCSVSRVVGIIHPHLL